MIAVVLNDVVVHVDQDSGREEEMCLECGRPLVFRASGGKDDSTPYWVPPTFQAPHELSPDCHNNKGGYSLSHLAVEGTFPKWPSHTSNHGPDCTRLTGEDAVLLRPQARWDADTK